LHAATDIEHNILEDDENMAEENCDEPQAKRARKAEQGARTGSAKACQKTKLKRQHQLESIISRLDASAYEQCADMVEHMHITVKNSNGLAMLKEALGKTPNIPKFCAAAATYHHTMLTQLPKVTLRIYDHALLVHVPELLEHGSLLDGSSWFLEAFNRLWKKRLTQHSNHGGGRKTKEQEEVAELAKHSAAGKKLYHAMKANKLDRQALQALWITSKPEFRGLASNWERSGMLEAINT
jgi:hypothetical protein